MVQARVCEPCLRHQAINGGGTSGYSHPERVFPAASMAVGATSQFGNVWDSFVYAFLRFFEYVCFFGCNMKIASCESCA